MVKNYPDFESTKIYRDYKVSLNINGFTMLFLSIWLVLSASQLGYLL